MSDPIEILRDHAEWFLAMQPLVHPFGHPEPFKAAIVEIERRARIEACAEAWLSQAAPPGYDGPPMLRRLIWTFDGQRHGWFTDQWYFDPDKYTALEKALDAAGAP